MNTNKKMKDPLVEVIQYTLNISFPIATHLYAQGKRFAIDVYFIFGAGETKTNEEKRHVQNDKNYVHKRKNAIIYPTQMP